MIKKRNSYKTSYYTTSQCVISLYDISKKSFMRLTVILVKMKIKRKEIIKTIWQSRVTGHA